MGCRAKEEDALRDPLMLDEPTMSGAGFDVLRSALQNPQPGILAGCQMGQLLRQYRNR